MGKNNFYDCKCANKKCKANQTRGSITYDPSNEQVVEKPKQRRAFDHTVIYDPDNVLWDSKNADEYWSRSTIRTYPTVANASGIMNNEILTVTERNTMFDGPKKVYHRRHFGNNITKSYLDDFF